MQIYFKFLLLFDRYFPRRFTLRIASRIVLVEELWVWTEHAQRYVFPETHAVVRRMGPRFENRKSPFVPVEFIGLSIVFVS